MSGVFGDPTLPRHRRLHLEACQVPGAGAWLTANPSCVDSHVPSPLFRVALQRRLRMPLWITTRRVACVGRCWTVGVITPSPVAAVEIGFCATTLSAMWSAPRSRSSRQSRLNLKSLASSSPRGRPILEVPTPMSTPPLYPPLRLPLVAALAASLVAGRGATFCPLVLEACWSGWSQAFRPGHRLTQGHQPQDCTAHQLHPSQGKRACNPETFPGVRQFSFCWYPAKMTPRVPGVTISPYTCVICYCVITTCVHFHRAP